MNPRRTGHLPDHPEVVRRRVGLHVAPFFGAMMALASSLPMSTSNRANIDPAKGGPGILDQHDTGSCEGHAHASGATIFLVGQGQSRGLISPVQLYLGALYVDRTLNPDGTLSTPTDTGTMPSSIVKAWQNYGALLAKDDPQYPARSTSLYKTPSDPNSPLLLPPPERLYADGAYRFEGAYFLASQGAQRLLDTLTALAAGRPVSDAIPASGDKFQGYTGGVLGALDGPVDHANLIVDYAFGGTTEQWTQFTTRLAQGTVDSTLVRLLVFTCDNSWGEQWGIGDTVANVAGGLYQADVDYFNQAEDLCVLDLSAAA